MFGLAERIRRWRSSYARIAACEARLARRFHERTGIAFQDLDFVIRREMMADAIACGADAALERYLALEQSLLERAEDRETAAQDLKATYRAGAA